MHAHRSNLAGYVLALLLLPQIASAGRLFDASGLLIGSPQFPRGATLADVNRDGMDDLIVGLSGGAGFGTALALGGGLFAPFTLALPGRGDLVVTVTDLDGDGLLDLAGAGFFHFGPDSSVVCATFGDGGGGWVDSFQVRLPAISEAIAAGDLDGDGRADLVVSLSDSNIVVYHSNANRTLTLVGEYPTPAEARNVTFGDLVGTSAVDVLVGSSEYAGVSVFEGTGTGSLGARSDIGLGTTVSLPMLSNVDSAPGLDLVLNSPSVQFASGVPGGFAAPMMLPMGALGFGTVVHDLNHDGKLDVVSGNIPLPSRGVVSWLGDGTGGFGPRMLSGRAVFAPGGLAGGDVDEDGNLDVVYPGSFQYSFVLCMGNGDGTFGAPDPCPAIPGRLSSLASGDFDNDGFLDAVGSNTSSNTLAFAKGHGNGTFDPLVVSGNVGIGYTRLAAGLFDGDSNLDLVAAPTNAPTFSFLRGHGDGTFDPPVNYTLPGNPSPFTVLDLNADGRADVVVPCASADGLAVFLQGPTGLTAPAFSPTPPGPAAVRYADLNADGRPDRVVACAGQTVVQLDNGTGGYSTLESHAQSPSSNDLDLADLDEDGTLDVVMSIGPATPPPPAMIRILKGHPGGNFDSDSFASLDWYQLVPSVVITHPSAALIVARDLDHDGHVDLLSKDVSNTGFVMCARGRGDRTFERREAYASTYGSSAIALGDFDGNGFDDVLGSGSNGSTPITSIVLLRNRSAGVASVPPHSVSAAAIHLAITALAPNPTHGKFAIDLRSSAAGTASIALCSPGGRRVFARDGIALAAGSNRVTLDAGLLAPGVYWVRATRGDASATRKMVVLAN